MTESIPALAEAGDVYQYALFLSDGGRFKISDIGNYTSWDVEKLRLAALLANFKAASRNVLPKPGTAEYEYAAWHDEPVWNRDKQSKLDGVSKALIRATAEAVNRSARRSRPR